MTAAEAHRGTEVINITDSDHAEEVCTLNFHCVAICAYLQKGDTDNPQSENRISEGKECAYCKGKSCFSITQVAF